MDDDLNVGNLLETRLERAPSSQSTDPLAVTSALKGKVAVPLTALALAAVVVVVAVVVISGTAGGRRVPMAERY
jgi:hypothetical protein